MPFTQSFQRISQKGCISPQKFLNRWAEWNIMLGYNEARMRASLKTLGIDEIPSTVSFSPN